LNLSLLFQFWVVMVAGRINAYQQAIIEYKDEEIRCLCEQLQEATGRKKPRFTDAQRARLAVLAFKLGRATLGEISTLVTPDTLLRWHRKLIAQKYGGSKNKGPGRPRLNTAIRDQIMTFAKANRTWGYERISGELAKVEMDASSTSVENVLKANGLRPAPGHGKQMNWDEFLKAHWDVLSATDFFTVEVWQRCHLVRYLVLFVIDLPTRKVEIIGIAPEPDGEWMKQMARNMSDCFTGPLKDNLILIHDRDPLFTAEFRRILKAAGVVCKKLPPRYPNLNAFAERFVKSIKHECLNKMIFFGEKQLRYAVGQYIEHYNEERPHQGIGNVLITPAEDSHIVGKIHCRERLGGTLKHYCRKAA